MFVGQWITLDTFMTVFYLMSIYMYRCTHNYACICVRACVTLCDFMQMYNCLCVICDLYQTSCPH